MYERGDFLFTIEQFAQICGIEVAKVKEYIETGYIESSLTCFNMKHVEQIRLIQQMHIYGFKREDIEMVLEGKMAIDDILKLRIYEIENSIERAYHLIEDIRKVRTKLAEGQAFIPELKTTEPVLEILPEHWGCSVRQRVHNQAINYLLRRLQAKMKAYHLRPAGNLIRMIHDDAPASDDVDMELFFPVEMTDEVPCEQLKNMPAVQVVSVEVQGLYNALPLAYATLYQWMETHAYQASGVGIEEFRCGVLTKAGVIPQIQLDTAKEPMQFNVKISLPVIGSQEPRAKS